MSVWKYDLRGAIDKEVQKAVDDIVKQKDNAMAMEFTRVIFDLLKENGVTVEMTETEEENHATNKFEVKYGFAFTGFDFSEHDKMVAEEKNKRIAELERQIGVYRERNILLRQRCTAEARDLFDCEMFGSFIITIPRKSNDNAIIEKMEEDLNRLTMDLKNRMGQIYELREEIKMIKEEKDRLAEMINDLLEDDTSELEEKLKNACGENQKLKIAVDVLSKRIAELMEVHEF